MNTDLDQILRASVEAHAEALTPVVPPRARISANLRAVARRRRRRQAAGAAAALALVLVAGVAAQVTPWRRTAAVPAQRVEEVQQDRRGVGPAVTDGGVTTWPTRGSLAGRKDLLARARTRLAEQGTVLSIPFAGDVAGVRLVLAVAPTTWRPGPPSRDWSTPGAPR